VSTPWDESLTQALQQATQAMKLEALRGDATTESLTARTIQAFLTALPLDRSGPATRYVPGGSSAYDPRVLAGQVERRIVRKEVVLKAFCVSWWQRPCEPYRAEFKVWLKGAGADDSDQNWGAAVMAESPEEARRMVRASIPEGDFLYFDSCEERSREWYFVRSGYRPGQTG